MILKNEKSSSVFLIQTSVSLRGLIPRRFTASKSRNDKLRRQFPPSAGTFCTFSFHKLHGFVFDGLDALGRAVLLLILQVTLEEELDLLGRNAEVDHPIEERPERGGERHVVQDTFGIS